MAEKKKCRVVIKRASGGECELPVEECCEDKDGCRVVVVRCDADSSDCCCPDK
jgi:hypothetical protein